VCSRSRGRNRLARRRFRARMPISAASARSTPSGGIQPRPRVGCR